MRAILLDIHTKFILVSAQNNKNMHNKINSQYNG